MKEESAKKIIDAIKRDKIKPKNRAYFIAKRLIFWFVLGLIIVLASMFLSLAILSLVDFDLELLRALHLGRYIRILILTAPYLWILLLAACIFLSYYVFRKTKKGYRYSMLLVAVVILLVVSALGVGAHIVRVNERMEKAISIGPPILGRIAPHRERRFLRPDEGVLTGKITEIEIEEFKLLTPIDELWEVFYNEETVYRSEDIQIGERTIVVVGEKTGEREFVAEKIKQLTPPGQKMRLFREERINMQREMPIQDMPGKAKGSGGRFKQN